MTGGNLVPMTLQKQNVVIAVVADIVAYAAVWYIKCIGVKQSSPAPGSANSTAVVSLVVQQDANAQFVGEVCAFCEKNLLEKILHAFSVHTA